MNESSLSSSSTRVDLGVGVEAVEVLRVDERPVLVERLGRDDHAPLVAEVGRLERHGALVPVRAELELARGSRRA